MMRIRGLPMLRRKLLGLTDLEERAIRIEIKRGLLNIETSAKRRVRKDQGELANSITHEVELDGLSGRAGTNKRHGAPVEFGTRPHFPPLAPLREWAVRHGLPESAAYPIALRIAREGSQPSPFLMPAFEEERPKFLGRLSRALDRAHREASR